MKVSKNTNQKVDSMKKVQREMNEGNKYFYLCYIIKYTEQNYAVGGKLLDLTILSSSFAILQEKTLTDTVQRILLDNDCIHETNTICQNI